MDPGSNPQVRYTAARYERPLCATQWPGDNYLRWLVIHKWIEIVFVPTKEQLADILTKVVDFNTFVAACKILFNQRSRAARS